MSLKNEVAGTAGLIDKVYSLNTLEIAWEQVRKNAGAAGVDKISIEKFKFKAGFYLEELHEQLKENRYIPEAVKRIYIPKGQGERIVLGVPAVKDRIVQAAVKLVIEPIFENKFMPMSYGFRPEKSVKEVLKEVDSLIKQG